MKKSVLFVLFALISVAGFSQITGWNAKVGMNFSNYTGDLDLNAKVGFKLGGGFEYAFNDTWSLQPSLFLTSKGAKKDGNSINAMYLELPRMRAVSYFSWKAALIFSACCVACFAAFAPQILHLFIPGKRPR